MEAQRMPSGASAQLSSAGSSLDAQAEKGGEDVCSTKKGILPGHPHADKSLDKRPSDFHSGHKGGLSHSSDWARAKLLATSSEEQCSLSSSPLEKEVYEYIPDAALSLAPQEAQASSSLLPAVSSIASRPARAKGCDVDEQTVPPAVAFETFRGKIYETTQVADSFPYFAGGPRESHRGAHNSYISGDYSRQTPMEATGSAEVKDTTFYPNSADFDTGFETPLGRLQRLRMEVEEMLDFVSSFHREGIRAATTAEQSATVEMAEVKAASREASAVTRPPYAKEKKALLFGQDPQFLLSELGRLRMQILSVMNDPSLQQIFTGVEPTTGKQRGGEALLKHLEEVHGNLGVLQQTASVQASDSDQGPPFRKEQAPAATVLAESDKTDDAGKVSRRGGWPASPGSPAYAETNGLVQYDIYCVPSFTPLLESSRAASLERRLAHVESRIGINKISLLPFPNLQQGITYISQKLALLDANKVEQLHKRTQRLLHELHALQHRRKELDISGASTQLRETGKGFHARATAADGVRYGNNSREVAATRAAAADDQRVEELFDICERWKVKAAALPSVLERLKALKTVHCEAGGISVRLQVLEEQQVQLQAIISSAEQNLEGLRKTVGETVAWATTTVQVMQRRLQRLEASGTEFHEDKIK